MRTTLLFVLAVSILASACSNSGTASWSRINTSANIADYYDFIRRHPHSPLVQTAQAVIDSLEWGNASRRNTVSDYDNYIFKHPRGRYLSNARTCIETLDWMAAERANTIDSYTVYLKKHSESAHSDQGYQILWDDALFRGGYKSIAEYIRKWPLSPKISTARTTLWAVSKKDNNIELVRQYITEWPETPFTEEAKAYLDSLLWQRASTANTYLSYYDYLKDEYKSRYTAEATARKDALDDEAWLALQGYPETYLKSIPEGKHKETAVKSFLSGDAMIGMDVKACKDLLSSDFLQQVELIVKDFPGQAGKGTLKIYRRVVKKFDGYADVAVKAGTYGNSETQWVWGSIQETYAVKIAVFDYVSGMIASAQMFDADKTEKLLLRRYVYYKHEGGWGISDESFNHEGFNKK